MILFRNVNRLISLRNGFRRLSSQISVDEDLPITTIDDPYKKQIKRCVICVNDIPLDYKNVRLLSQFVSPYTGKVYDAHITGLCNNMQEKISNLIGRARDSGLMAHETKETIFLTDPNLKVHKKFQR